ncbi:hypothetical protein RH915_10730, partial [Serpentinicella sp. ANB-PHB4]|uniref:hypothetical protein n=1 Tax=Serpentinicella sp. ANB-PHB4 TaxID=3074076 RepID=UPI00285AC595|nr:hypothetical protein [Serpentinicella sp. ANB-PHB4]
MIKKNVIRRPTYIALMIMTNIIFSIFINVNASAEGITTSALPTELESLVIEGNGIERSVQRIKATGSSTNGVLYQFWVNDLSENRWRMVRDYGESGIFDWTPKKAGNYRYGVHIKDKESEERLDSHRYEDIEIKPLPTELESLVIEGNGIERSVQRIKATGSSTN